MRGRRDDVFREEVDHPRRDLQRVVGLRYPLGEERLALAMVIIVTRYMADERVPYTGLIRLHFLHHAVQEPVWGLAIEKSGGHGYKDSPDTLYPILHGPDI